MAGSRAAAYTSYAMKDEIDIKRGVRQGDGLSSVMFNISIEAIIRECGFEGSIIEKSVQVQAYADDMVHSHL